MRHKHQVRKRQQKQIATERIETLERLAEAKALSGDLVLAQRYVELARRISTRIVVPLPSSAKRRICRNCGSYLMPGRTSRTRIHRGHIVIFCTNCNEISRFPLHQKKKRIQGIAAVEN